MQQHEIALESGCVYHIYNRGINGVEIFSSPDNYRFFLQQYAIYLTDYVDTYAYCLMTNHFHLLIRVKETTLTTDTLPASGVHAVDRLVSKQFVSYSAAILKPITRLVFGRALCWKVRLNGNLSNQKTISPHCCTTYTRTPSCMELSVIFVSTFIPLIEAICTLKSQPDWTENTC